MSMIIIFILLFQPSPSSPSAVLPKDVGEDHVPSASGGSSVVDPARRMNDEGPNQRSINDFDGDVVLPSEDMYCGIDWLDASRECHEPCPTGYDAECLKPGWTCQWYTGCAVKLVSKSESEVSLASEHLLPEVRTHSNTTNVSCPDCQNGAACVYQEDEKDLYCDCSTATAGPNEDGILFAGKYCEHEATDYCVALDENGNRLFCTNFGKCPFEIERQSCDCRGGYFGVHCEYLATVEGPPSLQEIPPLEEALPLTYDETRPCNATNECMYNSTCVYELSTGDPYCDCSTATKGPNTEETLFAGKYCEFEATSYCMVFDINGKQLFCTNFGKCPQEGTSGSCNCPGGHYGMHCEYTSLPESDDGVEVDSDFNDDDTVLDGVQIIPETNSTETTEEKITRNSTIGVPWQKCPSEVAIPSEATVCVGRIVERPDQPNVAFCDCRTESPIFLGECCAYPKVTYCTTNNSMFFSKFCANGGICRGSGGEIFHETECICPSNYYGEHCEFKETSSDGSMETAPSKTPVSIYGDSEKEIIHCTLDELLVDTHYCLNGGRCIDPENVDSQHMGCRCPPEFFGSHCEYIKSDEYVGGLNDDDLSVTPAPPDILYPVYPSSTPTCYLKCYNGGYCSHSDDGVRKDYCTCSINVIEFCVCPPGFMGNQCDQRFQPTPPPLMTTSFPTPFLSDNSIFHPSVECPICDINGVRECVSYGNGKVGCRCDDGMTGKSCNVTVDSLMTYDIEDERTQLKVFYLATSGQNWVNTTNWVSDIDKCLWFGVSCNEGGNISSISLPLNDLLGGGDVAWFSLHNLVHLRELDLSGNLLSGSMPPLFSSTLEFLDLSRNNIDSNLHSWASVPRLSLLHLNLSYNKLTSSIPVEIGRMTNLMNLNLAGNDFTYEFQELYFRDLKNLTHLDLSSNGLVGELPSFLGNYYPNLSHVNVSSNDMKGDIPTDLFANSSADIITLDISYNSFGRAFMNLDIDYLNIDAVGNQFVRLDYQACLNKNWNNGSVKDFGCDALLCPPGYFNLAGRQTSADNPCLPCESAYSYGTTVCETTSPTLRPTSKPVSRHGLEQFFESTRGEDWMRNDNWLSDTSVCSWFGVKCNSQSEIIELILPSNQLNGYLDQNAFSNFQHVTKIDLSGNFLYGDLNFFPNTMELQSLNLSKNQLRGTVSNILGRFPNLEELILNGNDLSWFNPFGYENLRILDLSDNAIAGTVQYDLPKLWNLERVSLSGNMLEGGFPDSYSSLRNLTEFQIGWNSISGDITNSPWRENANLRVLNISHNFLRGTIPKDLMESSFGSISLHNTTISIDLSFNYFESTLPDFDIEFLDIEVVGNILSDIDSRACERDWNGGDAKRFGCNGIACTIGSSNELGRQTGSNQCLPCQQAIYIGTVGCNDENRKPTMPPIGLSQRTTLEMFYYRTNGNSWGNNLNWLSELMYCEWFGVECDDTNFVSSLKLSSNSLEGQIVFKDLSGLPRLELLDLSENRLTGIITNGIVDLGERSMKSINLSNNFLSGTIPDFPTVKLEVLDLSKNNLSGEIPNFDMPNLSVLDLSHNNLSGTIPIFQENRLMRYLNFSNNNLIGEIPPEVIPISDYPVFLDLSFNNLSGVVPYVRTFDLFIYVAGNLLEGIDGDYCDVEADCDKIACSVGFWNPEGRESDESLCQPCPSAIYIGSVECSTANTAPSAAPVEESACSSDHKCRNGAKCIPNKDGGYYCDCKSISTTWFEIYAGEFCEYQATEFCSDLYHVASYSFCVNGGQCLAVDIMPGAPHPGCSCPQDFVGKHCEFLLSNRPSNSPSDFITFEPTSNQTSSPILLSKTFDLHELPPFSMVLLSSNESELSLSSLGVLELILEGFLYDELAPLFHTPDSFYITALRLSPDEPYLHASGLSNISEQSKGLIFTKVSGIVSLREGIVPDADEFLKTSMPSAFQSTRSLAERIQISGNSELQSVLKVELTNRLEICPDNLRCLHGSQCIEFDDGGFGCDCSLASGNSSAIVYDGMQCEFIATEFCSDDIKVKQYSYCVNSGNCGRKNITVSEPHPGCWCSELFEGPHCQFVKDGSLPRNINASKKYSLTEKPSSDFALGTDAYVIFFIMGVGLIITVVILLYKSKQRRSTLVKNPSGRGMMDREETSVLALEAGVATNSSRTGPPTTTVEEEKEEIAAIPTTHYEVSWSNDQKTISTTQNEESERPASSIKQTNEEVINTLADETGARATAYSSVTKHLERGPVEVPLHQEILAEEEECDPTVTFIPGDSLEGNAGLASEPTLENNEDKSSSQDNPLSDCSGKSDRTLDEEVETSAMKNISFHGNQYCSSEAIPTSQEGSTVVDDGHEELVTANNNIDVAIDSKIVYPCKSAGPGDSELNEKL